MLHSAVVKQGIGVGARGRVKRKGADRVQVRAEEWQIIVEAVTAMCRRQLPDQKEVSSMVHAGTLGEDLLRAFNNHVHFRLIHERRGVSLLFGSPGGLGRPPAVKLWPPPPDDDLRD